MSATISIREYSDHDEAAVASLWNAVFNYSQPHNDPHFSIERSCAFGDHLFFVAVAGSAPVGTVMGGYDGHRGWIYSLAVHPNYRQTGVATTLMRTVEAALVKLGCFKINLQVLPNNRTVVDFYTKLGYAIEERVSLAKIIPANI